MQTFLTKHRWVLLLAVTLGQCVANFPQGWAVFQPYITVQYGYTADAATSIMPITVAFYGVVSILGGRFQDKVSPRRAALLGTASVALAFFNAWWIPGGNPLYMYLGFSLFFGGGCGFLTQALVATLMKWYADRMGFAGGFSGAVSGLYMIGQTYVTEALLSRVSARTAMLVMGIYSLIVALAVACLLISPTPEYMVEKRALAAQKSAGRTNAKVVDFTPTQMLRTRQYYLLFAAIMFIYPAYQLLSPQLVSLCTARGLSKDLALSTVALGSAAAAAGRLVIPSLSDRLGRKPTMAAMWCLTTLAAFLFMVSGPATLPAIWGLLALVYSGGFALVAPFTRDLFGFANSGANAGLVSLSESAGSLLGPALLALLGPVLGGNTVHLVGVASAALATGAVLLINTNVTPPMSHKNA